MARYVGRVSPQAQSAAIWTAEATVDSNDNIDSMDFTANGDKSKIAKSRIESRTFNAFGMEDDYIYLGMEERFDMVLFCLESGINSAEYFEWEYYDGVNWLEFIPGVDYNFYETGAERIDRLTNWRKSIINSSDGIHENIPDQVLRYWIRVHPKEKSREEEAVIQQVVFRQYAEYCTVEEVAELLQLTTGFSDSSTPSYNTVEDLIHNAQSFIDHRSRKSWRLNIAIEEEHQFNRLGQRIVKHYPIELLKVEIWDGSEYENKNLGRTQEVFLIKETGMVHWSRFFLFPSRLRVYAGGFYGWGFGEFNFPVRFTYLYGSNIYENEREGGLVNDVAKKLTAIDVIQNYDFSVNLPSGANIIDLARKSDLWRAECEEKIDSLIAWTVF